jgi:hypothetical protein
MAVRKWMSGARSAFRFLRAVEEGFGIRLAVINGFRVSPRRRNQNTNFGLGINVTPSPHQPR